MYQETWAYNYLIIPNDDNFSERFGESNFLHEFEESGYSVVRQYDRGETLRTKQFLNRCRKVVESSKLSCRVNINSLDALERHGEERKLGKSSLRSIRRRTWICTETL